MSPLMCGGAVFVDGVEFLHVLVFVSVCAHDLLVRDHLIDECRLAAACFGL